LRALRLYHSLCQNKVLVDMETAGGDSVTPKRSITVAAGLIWGPDGRLLVSQRLPDAHRGGLWELPGGKLERDECAAEALMREIREELDVEVEVGGEFNRVTHEYEDLNVTLIGLHSRHIAGQPKLLGVAAFRWVTPGQLLTLEFPEANRLLFDADWRTPPIEWMIPLLS
jgi:8-oxo-dGTP diphosphatase